MELASKSIQMDDARVDALSVFFCSLLSMRDHEVDNGRTTLGKLMFHECLHSPTESQLEAMEGIRSDIEWCESTLDTTMRLLCTISSGIEAQEAPAFAAPFNVQLQPYEEDQCFGKRRVFCRQRGATKTTIDVGGLGRAVRLALQPLVLEWLHECDRQLCVAFDDTVCCATPPEVTEFLETTAEHIARRLTLTTDPSQDPLTPRFLEHRAGKEFHRTLLEAEDDQNRDLQALITFERVARGPTAQSWGRTMDHLRWIVNNTPVELAVPNSERMNLPLLKEALSHHDSEVCFRMIVQWQGLHGAFAASAARQAVDRVQSWSPRKMAKCLNVIAKGGAGPRLPASDFVCVDPSWRFLANGPRRAGRTGLDAPGRRVVRITSMLWQLVANGELRPGTVHYKPAETAAVRTKEEAEVVLKQLGREFQIAVYGFFYLRFRQDLQDSGSHLDAAVGHAMCALSHFSMVDLIDAVHPLSPKRPVYEVRLEERTRALVPVGMPREFTRFVSHTLEFALPLIVRERNRQCVQPWHSTCALVELLNTSPRARAWRPENGALRLTMQDLGEACPILEDVLRELSKAGTFVRYHRPYAGGGRRTAQQVFDFNTAALRNVMWLGWEPPSELV